jgi:hypothetical protein
MICAFALTFKNVIGTYPTTRSDYDRKHLECSRALESLFADNVFGNPNGTDIRFLFNTKSLMDVSRFMDQLKLTTDRPQNERLVFGSYRLDKIFRTDLLEPSSRTSDPYTQNTQSTRKSRGKLSKGAQEHYQSTMIFTDIETDISIKATLEQDNGQHNVLNCDVRIQTIDYIGPNIWNTLPDLALRRVVSVKNIAQMIPTLTRTMVRTKRVKIWESILRVIEKDIQFLNQGYRCVVIGDNKMIKISTEEEGGAPCGITLIPAPYTKIHLACGHELSIMAIYGIIYKGQSSDSESITCPMCRRNLIREHVVIQV